MSYSWNTLEINFSKSIIDVPRWMSHTDHCVQHAFNSNFEISSMSLLFLKIFSNFPLGLFLEVSVVVRVYISQRVTFK